MKIITLGKIIFPMQGLKIGKVITATESDGLYVIDFPTAVNAFAALVTCIY